MNELTKEDSLRKRELEVGEEEKLKKMLEEYWREQYGDDLSKELEEDLENLKNKNPRAKGSYAYVIDLDERSSPLEKDETDSLSDDGYEGGEVEQENNGSGLFRVFGGSGDGGSDDGGKKGSGKGNEGNDGVEESSGGGDEDEVVNVEVENLEGLNKFVEEKFPGIDYGMRKIAKLSVLNFLRSKRKLVCDFDDIDKDELFVEVSRVIDIFDVGDVVDIVNVVERLEEQEEFFKEVCDRGFDKYSLLVRDLPETIYFNYQEVAESVDLDVNCLEEGKKVLCKLKMDLRKRSLFYLIYSYGSGNYIHSKDDDRKLILAGLIEGLPGSRGLGGLEYQSYLGDMQKMDKLAKVFVDVVVGCYDHDLFSDKKMITVFKEVFKELFVNKQMDFVVSFEQDMVDNYNEVLDGYKKDKDVIKNNIRILKNYITLLNKLAEEGKSVADEMVGSGMLLKKRKGELVEIEEKISIVTKEMDVAKCDLKRFLNLFCLSSEEEYRSAINFLVELLKNKNISQEVRELIKEFKSLVDDIIRIYRLGYE